MRLRTAAPVGLTTLIGATVGVYLLALAINLPAVVDSLYAHADASAALVIAELMPDAPSNREIVLGDYNWVEALWVLRATGWLPHHYAAWQALPFLVWAATVALVAGAVGLTAGRRAGLLTAAVAICLGFNAREVFWTLNFHGLVVFHTALLAFGVAWVAARPAWLQRRAGIVAAVLLGAVTAVGVQDQMLLAVGILPVVALGVAWTWRTGLRGPLLLAAIVGVVAVGGGAVLHQVVSDAGIIRDERAFVFTPGGALLDHVGLLIGAIGELAAGQSLGHEVDVISVIALLGLILASAATVAVAWRGWTLVRDEAARPRGAVEPAPGDVLLVFWALVIAATVASWMLSGFVADVTDVRYLGALWMGVAAGLGVLSARVDSARWSVAAVAGLCLVATIGVLHQIEPTKHSHFPTPREAAAVRSFVLANGARTGFAGNWDAFPLTWHNRFAIRATPLVNCGDATDPERDCPPPQHRISSWYAPQGVRRSFLVLDSGQPGNPGVDRRFGKPVAFTNYKTYSIFVFDHDIARDVRPPGTRR